MDRTYTAPFYLITILKALYNTIFAIIYPFVQHSAKSLQRIDQRISSYVFLEPSPDLNYRRKINFRN